VDPPSPAHSVHSRAAIQQRPLSPAGTVSAQSSNYNFPRPPLPIRRVPFLSTNSAFSSYVRRRGEPDGSGGQTDSDNQTTTVSRMVNAANIILDSHSMTNMTDSELSDGYFSQQQLGINEHLSRALGFPSKVKTLGRPGGGGESDAAFTPSPVTIPNADTNVQLALAHQTRIRNLYTNSGISGFLSEQTALDMQGHHHGHGIPNSRRPDSSSSASSATDWEGSGHATVLRRANQNLPPMPPPRQTLPIVDSLGPLTPVYNNLGGKASTKGILVGNTLVESTSSDSEFERGFDLRGRQKLKPQSHQPILGRKMIEQFGFMDRLSVRTEISASAQNTQTAISGAKVKAITITDNETDISLAPNNLYFAHTDADVLINETSHSADKKELKKPNSGGNNKNIQDSILRHMHREMTPTISEVYHERNIGLGLAPPLSKLLLSKNYDEPEAKMSSSHSGGGSTSGVGTSLLKVKSLADAINDIDLNAATAAGDGEFCSNCNSLPCACNPTNPATASASSNSTTMKKLSIKPWLSNITTSIVKGSDLTTADILEHQTKFKSSLASNSSSTENSLSTVKRVGSPYSELSRRDEGDGRSVADSQCSGSFRTDLTTVATVSTLNKTTTNGNNSSNINNGNNSISNNSKSMTTRSKFVLDA
jgi:hypothetical protein